MPETKCPHCEVKIQFQSYSGRYNLTRREAEVADTFISHVTKNYRDIAAKLGIREDTLKRFATNIYNKVGCCCREELTLWAIIYPTESNESKWLKIMSHHLSGGYFADVAGKQEARREQASA